MKSRLGGVPTGVAFLVAAVSDFVNFVSIDSIGSTFSGFPCLSKFILCSGFVYLDTGDVIGCT